VAGSVLTVVDFDHTNPLVEDPYSASQHFVEYLVFLEHLFVARPGLDGSPSNPCATAGGTAATTRA